MNLPKFFCPRIKEAKYNSDFMFLSKMIDFCKSINCPSSQDLLAYQACKSSEDSAKEIFNHLNLCEFCKAEVEFYEHYPQSVEENITTDEIPRPLYELAEALLNEKNKDKYNLNKLLKENEGLTLREV